MQKSFLEVPNTRIGLPAILSKGTRVFGDQRSKMAKNRKFFGILKSFSRVFLQSVAFLFGNTKLLAVLEGKP